MSGGKIILRLPALLTVFVLLLSASALAQEAIKPKGGWQVTRMEQQRSGPFCALTQNYANSMIVTLGRNMTEEYSLAVDFQKNRLDPEKSYTVTLRPGPGQTRSMELMPISERAIVMRLGWDESFFEALNVSQTLGFEVDGERFNFTLPEIRSGQQDLKACIDGIKDRTPTKADILTAQAGQAAKGFQAKRAEAPQAVESSISDLPVQEVETPRAIPPGQTALAAQNPDLLKQIASLRDENKSLRGRLGEQQKRFDEAFRNSTQSNEVQEMQEKIKLLEQENEALKAAPKPDLKPDLTQVASSDEALEKMRARFNEAEQEVTRLGKMLQTERKEKADLQDKLVKAEAKAPKLAKGQPDPKSLQKTVVERTAELERVRKQLSDEKKKTNAQAEQITALQKAAKSGDRTEQDKVLTKQMADLTKERDEALKQVATLQGAQKKLQAQLAASQQTVPSSEVAGLQSRLDNVTAQLKAQEKENKQMKSELVAMQNTVTRQASHTPVTSRVDAAKPVPRAVAAPKTRAPQFGKEKLQAALQRSGLGVHGVAPAGGQGLSWKTSAGVNGQAEIKPLSSMSGFTALVDQYIGAQKQKCGGDFAAVPSKQAAGQAQYEVACVGGTGGFASSLLFIAKEGQFVSIAHNTAPENMNSAMDARDRLATTLQ